MFNLFRKKKKEKKQGGIDKLVTGAIIGAAVGSVLGVGLAPKKGEETRKNFKNKASGLINKTKRKLLRKIKKFQNRFTPEIKRIGDKEKEEKKIPEEM